MEKWGIKPVIPGVVVQHVKNPYLYTLKGYCTGFQLALKSLEITVSVLSERMSKTARKNTKGLKSYKEFKF